MKIYVVVAHGGEYSDSWQSNVCAFDSDEKAQELINSMEEVRQIETPIEVFITPLFEKWTEENPAPVIPDSILYDKYAGKWSSIPNEEWDQHLAQNDIINKPFDDQWDILALEIIQNAFGDDVKNHIQNIYDNNRAQYQDIVRGETVRDYCFYSIDVIELK